MKRKVDEKTPFFAYVPYTQTHMSISAKEPMDTLTCNAYPA